MVYKPLRGLALEALQNANNDSSQTNNGNGNGHQTVKIDNMQKQIDYLIAELKHIKKCLNNLYIKKSVEDVSASTLLFFHFLMCPLDFQ